MTIKKNRRYIMLISTASPQWDIEAKEIIETLEKQQITIIKTIPMGGIKGVDFIGVSEEKNK